MGRIKRINTILLVTIIIFFSYVCLFFKTNIYSGKFQLTSNNKLQVHYIDVGQADSILIQSPNGRNMLIDAGETKNNAIINYINSLAIDKLDVVIATHPHNDHISEMADIINTYDIGDFYMPEVINTTKGFERMIDALSKNKVNTIKAKSGISIDFDKNIKCDIIAPCSTEYESLNNYSVVMKMTYKNNSFLFTGDAEDISEFEIIQSGVDLKSDVLKVGHHGSSTSTSQEFLNAVNPKYAIISLGEDNKYGHPHQEVIQRLKNTKTYMTSTNGLITVISDGENINIFNTNPNNKSSISEVTT